MNKNANELRHLQLKQLDILLEIKQLCDKHGIAYYLDSGTLLGAVRHEGFIPWDDDIDIVMPYDDYVEFLAIAKNELDSKFFLQTCDTDNNFYRAYTRIRMNNTTMLPKQLTKYHIHHGIWIDIFPLIQIGNGFEFKIKKRIITLSNYMQMEDYIRANYEEFRVLLGEFGIRVLFLFYKIPFIFRKKLHIYMLKSIFSAKNKKYVTQVWGGITHIFPKDLFDGAETYLSFENELFPVPPKYKQYLEILYGNYMELPPVENRCGHGDLLIDFENNFNHYQDL